MIAKKYRLNERETKKVLQKGKPFFSYEIVLNKLKNNYNYNRFAVVISSKSAKNSVERNFFRRKFYGIVSEYLTSDLGSDMVFVVKNKTKLDKKDENKVLLFEKELRFLLNKIF